jgi:2'-5' RNA ligase
MQHFKGGAGRADRRNVFVLDADTIGGLAREVSLEAAFVFRAPNALTDLVLELRERFPAIAPASEQLEPHLTVLYLGVGEGPALFSLISHLNNVSGLTIEAKVSGFGTFRSPGHKLNWHLSVVPEHSFRVLHDFAAGLCLKQGWKQASSYSGSNYVPHVTIWDQIDAANWTAPRPKLAALVLDTHIFSTPFAIGRFVDAEKQGQ